jgi:predicted anti-sigma-YlaC factor YlaD
MASRRKDHTDMEDDLACRELVELATDYLEGRLSAREYHRFEAHLIGCEGCRIYLQHVQETIGVLQADRGPCPA